MEDKKVLFYNKEFIVYLTAPVNLTYKDNTGNQEFDCSQTQTDVILELIDRFLAKQEKRIVLCYPDEFGRWLTSTVKSASYWVINEQPDDLYKAVALRRMDYQRAIRDEINNFVDNHTIIDYTDSDLVYIDDSNVVCHMKTDGLTQLQKHYLAKRRTNPFKTFCRQYDMTASKELKDVVYDNIDSTIEALVEKMKDVAYKRSTPFSKAAEIMGWSEVHLEDKGKFIRVRTNIIQGDRTREELMELISKYKFEFQLEAYLAIRLSGDFKTLDIPINFWKCTNMVLSRDNVLVFTFELRR